MPNHVVKYRLYGQRYPRRLWGAGSGSAEWLMINGGAAATLPAWAQAR